MVDNEYSIEISKSVKPSIAIKLKNPKMSKFVPYHRKTK